MKPRKRVFLYEYQQAHSDLAWGLILTLLGAFAGVVMVVLGMPL